MLDEVLDLDLLETARLVAQRHVSPIELLEAALARVDERNRSYGAFVTVAHGSAMEAAREADREIKSRRYRGPLHGLPVAVKDIIAVQGLPVTACSDVLENVVSEQDAPVVSGLREAGAILIGTTALDEFAFATVGTGITNPAAEDRSPGGSSGGSAVAVAARMCYAALGTDTGGSVRVPASCCGVVGLKPTSGWISTAAVVPLAWSLDHVGPLARSVPDIAAVFHALSGTEAPRADGAQDLAGRRVGVPTEEYLSVAHDSVLEAHALSIRALEDLGASIIEIDLLDSGLGLDLQYLTVLPEAAAYHFRRHGDRLSKYTEGVRAALEWGARVRAQDYIDAQRVRAVAARHISGIFDRVSVIALPTLPIPPPLVGQDEVVLRDGRREDVVSAMLQYTTLFNHTGHPAVSVPVANTVRPPLGLQLVGPYGSEDDLFHVSALYLEAAG